MTKFHNLRNSNHYELFQIPSLTLMKAYLAKSPPRNQINHQLPITSKPITATPSSLLLLAKPYHKSPNHTAKALMPPPKTTEPFHPHKKPKSLPLFNPHQSEIELRTRSHPHCPITFKVVLSLMHV